MKKIEVVTVLKNENLVDNIYDMIFLAEELSKDVKAGQFVEVYIDNNKNILPRPISICEVINNTIRIVYQVIGEGTKYLKNVKIGDNLRVLGNCGNGYTLLNSKVSILVGGGIGIPPLLETAKRLKGKKIAILGTKSNTILVDDFKNHVDEIYIATDDGSYGYKGNVVDLMREKGIKGNIIYSCGPKIMLKNLAKYADNINIPCQVSMEERMACGIGACVCCALKIKGEYENIFKKVCKDGPVFSSKEVIFDE